MKLRYKVSEENYLEMLEMQVKQKNRSLLSICITLLCTVGQFGVFLFLCFNGTIQGKDILTVGAMSVAAFALNVLYRFTTRRRAKVALERFKLSNKIPQDFWKEHTFEINHEKLTVRYGSLKSVYGLHQIKGYDTLESSFVIYAGGMVADLVPYSALADKQQFLDAVRDVQHNSIIENAEEQRDDVPTSYKYHFNYAYDLETYLAHQREAYRKRYTTKLAYDTHTLIRTAISCSAIAYIFMNPQPLMIVFCLLIIVFFNMQHIVTFTPLCDITIKSGLKDVLGHKPDPNTDTYVTPDNIIIRGSMHALDIPICDIKAMRPIKGGVALYLPKNVILTIPDVGGDFETFVKFMNYKAN